MLGKRIGISDGCAPRLRRGRSPDPMTFVLLSDLVIKRMGQDRSLVQDLLGASAVLESCAQQLGVSIVSPPR